ncbi:Ff.00g014440.m01.CDS01 [Fusarium sp. VM40]|nr:Ff.00g014440.m01.CDS01 [Fusarium sp. VM40]
MGSLGNTPPPFPEDVPIVPIARLSSRKLTSSCENEMKKVLRACETDGFFYLDLTDGLFGQALLDEADDILHVSKGALNQPLDYKMKFLAERGKEMFGYKPAGAVKKIDKDSRPDATEFFNVAKDHLLGNSKTREYPKEIMEHQKELLSFATDCHSLGLLILRILGEQLDLGPDEFVERNKILSLSGDHIRMTKMTAPSSQQSNIIGLPSHTDFGSVTVLFNWVGGL